MNVTNHSLSSYCVQGTALCAFHVVSHLIIKTAAFDRQSYHSHFTYKETDVNKCMSQSWWVSEAGFRPKPLAPAVWLLHTQSVVCPWIDTWTNGAGKQDHADWFQPLHSACGLWSLFWDRLASCPRPLGTWRLEHSLGVGFSVFGERALPFSLK